MGPLTQHATLRPRFLASAPRCTWMIWSQRFQHRDCRTFELIDTQTIRKARKLLKTNEAPPF